MFPIRLEMHAFGCFAEEQVLEFSQLPPNSLFLIHGPTGAGKSTILDAICYALYGEPAGSERSSKQLRSDLADNTTATKVVLDFSLGKGIYRVERRPEQQIRRKRGDGLRTAPTAATLWDRTNPEADGPEGRVLCAKASDVTAKVEELLGCSLDQFRQLIIIPQGEFRKLLSVDVKERKLILERLFRTEYYRQIEYALDEAAKEAERVAREVLGKVSLILEQQEVRTSAELKDKIASGYENLAQSEKAEGALTTALTQADEKLKAGNLDSAKFKELDAAQAEQLQLGEEKESYLERKHELARAKKASPLNEAAEIVREEREALSRASANLLKTKAELERVNTSLKAAQAKLGDENARSESLKKLEADLQTKTNLLPKTQRLAETAKLAAEAFKEKTKEQAKLQALREEEKEVKDRFAALDPLIQQTAEVAASGKVREMELEQLEELFTKVAAVSQSKKKLEEIAGILKIAEQSRLSAERDLAEKEAEISAVTKRRIEGQAHILAESLKEAEPCPVCGSKAHPNPAAAGAAVPSDAELAALDKIRAAHKASLTEAQSRSTQASQLLASERGKLEQLERDIQAQPNLSPEELKSEISNLEKAVATAKAASNQIAALTEEKKGLEKRLVDLGEDIELAGDASTRASETEAGYRMAANELESEIPPELRVHSTLAQQAGLLQKQIKDEKEALDADRAEVQRLSIEQSGLQSRLNERAATNKDAADKLSIREERFSGSLKEAGFKDQADFEDARRPPDHLACLEQYVKNYDERSRSSNDRLARAKQEVAHLSRPDLALLEKAKEDAQSAVHAQLKQSAELRSAHGRLKDALASVERMAAQQLELDKQYQTAKQVSDLARGQNAARVSLNTFVLSASFDEVLWSASARLRRMSEGRYELYRAKEAADRRFEAGLDLVVMDNYSGLERPVSTLSGGEGFLASLALALGLSDVVQAHAGGIRMDAMFIDEGFGSLDPDALDLAYQVLCDLQRNGRLIGVISHVPELRERMDLRLEVKPGKRGSTAQFVLP